MKMSVESQKRRSLNISKETLESRTLSDISLDSLNAKQVLLKNEIDNIRDSLDCIKSNILSQQFDIARDFEDRVRQTYDGVINDLNQVRQKVNTLGDEVAADRKFKSWVPVAPFRKEVIKNIYEIRKPSKLKSSKSVDFVDSCEKERSSNEHKDIYLYGLEGQGRFSSGKLRTASTIDLNKSKLGRSRSTLSSRANSTVSLHRQKSLHGSTVSVPETRTQVPGFGCCFTGDNKTYPYRTYKAKYYSFYRYNRPGHSWGPSRSGSRSTLDDDDWWDEDKGAMCGVVSDDWRMRVAPYMWEGWPLPGLDKNDVEKLRERLKKFDEIRDELVEVQNEYRVKHNCPALNVTEELSRDAQDWAELLAMKGYAQYSDSQSRGENILVIDIEDELSGRQVIDTWYREGQYFNYKRPGWQRGTSNFTQMIWRSTKEVGVGIAKFPYTDTYVIVAQYKPQGNINAPGQFRQNVPVPSYGIEEVNQQRDIKEIQNTQTDTTLTIKGNVKRKGTEFGTEKQPNTFPSVNQEIGKLREQIVHKSNPLDVSRDSAISGINESGMFDITNSLDDCETEQDHEINERRVEGLREDNILDRMKDHSFNGFETLSELSIADSTDDILIAMEDNPDELFKEKLVGRQLLDKQVVDEMIRELVNERIEQETRIIESDSELEPALHKMDLDTITFVDNVIEQNEIAILATENTKDIGHSCEKNTIPSSIDHKVESCSDFDTVSQIGSVSDSVLSERSDNFASVSDSVVSEEMPQTIHSVSDSVVSEKIDTFQGALEHTGKSCVRSVSDSELTDTSISDDIESDSSIESGVHSATRELNSRFVVKIDSRSEKITDV